MRKKVSRIIISALGSGSGKTSFTMGLIRLLVNKGVVLSSYKCGPDYIDTMFHTKALNVTCRNIDLFLSDKNTVKNIIAESDNLAIIEGVMGFYDGIAFTDECSTYHISMVTSSPVILVIDAKGKANTITALIKGIVDYKENNIKGVVLNRVSKGSYGMYKKIIEEELNIKVYGYIPEMKNCSLESRHLGLVTANEMKNIDEIINNIAITLEETVDYNEIIKTAELSQELEYEPINIEKIGSCKIGIAYDSAFCFHYKDNITVLEKLGAEIVYFSPLNDSSIIDCLDGLIFYGGYPELYLEQLASNKSFIQSLKNYYSKNIPIMAECGGYMYINKSINNIEVANLLEGDSIMRDKLQNFGYVYMETEKDSILGKKSTVLKAHEFHYSSMEQELSHCTMKKPLSKRSWKGCYLSDNLYAGYPHLYYLSNIDIAKNFIKSAIKYKENRK